MSARLRMGLTLALVLVWRSAILQADEPVTFDSNGVAIRYTVEGEGEPVLLVHGFTANIEMQWRSPGVIRELSKDYKVVAIDNRGHGKSGKPHAPDQYGMEMVEDQVRLLDHLGIERAHVIGYSMGGFITGRLITSHPERVISATLGGAGWAEPEEEFVVSFREELAGSLERGEGITPLIRRLTPEGAPPVDEDRLKFMNQMVLMMNDPQALAAVIRGMDKLAVSRDEVTACKVPTQCIIGGADPLKAGVDKLAETRTDVQVVVIDGADHMTTVGNPQFIESLRAFLKAHSAEVAEPAAAGK